MSVYTTISCHQRTWAVNTLRLQNLAVEALCGASSLELNKKMDWMLFWAPSVNCILIKPSS